MSLKNEIFADDERRDNNGTVFTNITGTNIDGKRGIDIVDRGQQPDGDWVTKKADGTAIERSETLGGTLLDGAINDSVTTITVDSTADFPSSGVIGIDAELISYTGKTATTFTGCTRGAYQTTAASHADNDPVGESFVSDWVDTDGWDSIELFVKSAQPSKILGLLVQFTDDVQDVSGTPTVRAEVRYSYDTEDVARGYEDIRLQAVLDGFRVVYTNGSVTQTDFFFHANLRVSGNVTRFNKGGALITGDFETEAALGLVSNYDIDTKFGRLKGMDALDTDRDIWGLADDNLTNRLDSKTFPSAASIFYFASSDSSDTSLELAVSYIDSNGFARIETVTLDGTDAQTPVALSREALDVNRMVVTSATVNQGEIYAATSNSFTLGVPDTLSETVSHILSGYGQTQQTQFTVPRRQRMIIKAYRVEVSRASGAAGSAVVTLRVKKEGEASIIKRELFPTSGSPTDKENANIVVDGRSQVVWRVDSVSDNDTQISCFWDYVLIDD